MTKPLGTLPFSHCPWILTTARGEAKGRSPSGRAFRASRTTLKRLGRSRSSKLERDLATQTCWWQARSLLQALGLDSDDLGTRGVAGRPTGGSRANGRLEDRAWERRECRGAPGGVTASPGRDTLRPPLPPSQLSPGRRGLGPRGGLWLQQREGLSGSQQTAQRGVPAGNQNAFRNGGGGGGGEVDGDGKKKPQNNRRWRGEEKKSRVLGNFFVQPHFTGEETGGFYQTCSQARG